MSEPKERFPIPKTLGESVALLDGIVMAYLEGADLNNYSDIDDTEDVEVAWNMLFDFYKKHEEKPNE